MHDDEEHSERSDDAAGMASGKRELRATKRSRSIGLAILFAAASRWRDAPRTSLRPRGLVFLVAAVAIGLAACGGGSTDRPPVASMSHNSDNGSNSGGSTTTAPKAGNPTRLMDEWAACMRKSGDPDQTDPTIDAHGVINIILPLGVSPTMSSEVHGSTGPCSQYELAAENALRAGQQYTGPSFAQAVQYTDCMRANGVTKYPDPSPDGRTDFNGTGVDPNSPFVEKANKVCGQKLGLPAWWINGWGPPGDVTVTSAGLNPNGEPSGNGGGRPVPPRSGNSGPAANAANSDVGDADG